MQFVNAPIKHKSIELKIKWLRTPRSASATKSNLQLLIYWLQTLLACIDKDTNKQHYQVRFWSHWLIFCSRESLSFFASARHAIKILSKRCARITPFYFFFRYKAQYKFIEQCTIHRLASYHFRCAHRECFILLHLSSAGHRPSIGAYRKRTKCGVKTTSTRCLASGTDQALGK